MMKAPHRLARSTVRKDAGPPARIELLEDDADRIEGEVEAFKVETRGKYETLSTKLDTIANRINAGLLAIVLLGIGAWADAAVRGL